MKYLKVFNSHTTYDEFISNEKHISPIVSFCIDNEDVHFCKNTRLLDINCPYTNLDVSKYRLDYQKEYNQNIYPIPGYYINDLNVSIGDENVTSTVWDGETIHVDHVYDHITISSSTNSTLVSNTFTKRTTGNGLTILNENALVENIKGNSIYWNQLCDSGDSSIYSCTAYVVRIKNLTRSIPANHKVYISYYYRLSTDFEVPSGWINPQVILNQNNSNLYGGGVNATIITDYEWHKAHGIVRNANSNNNCLSLNAGKTPAQGTPNITGTFEVKSVMAIDLTLMFGEGNEPTTVAQFETLFPLDYYNVQNGQYLHFNTTLRSIFVPDILAWVNRTENLSFVHSQNSVQVRFNNGSYTITGTCTATATVALTGSNMALVKGHKYLCISKGICHLLWYVRRGSSYTQIAGTTGITNGSFYTAGTNANDNRFNFGLTMNKSTTYNREGYVSVFDLTEMFGAGNEPSTVNEFNSYLELLNNPTTTEEFESANFHDISFNINTIEYNNNLLFPNGLKSVGDTYDELYKDPLDNTWKAIKRIDSNNIELEFEELYILNDLELNNVIKVRTNGLEQIYPVNSSVPYTAPMNLDIRYGADPIS